MGELGLQAEEDSPEVGETGVQIWRVWPCSPGQDTPRRAAASGSPSDAGCSGGSREEAGDTQALLGITSTHLLQLALRGFVGSSHSVGSPLPSAPLKWVPPRAPGRGWTETQRAPWCGCGCPSRLFSYDSDFWGLTPWMG